MKWYIKVIRLYADFSGRARRKEYWMFTLFNFIFSSALLWVGCAIAPIFKNDPSLGPLTAVYAIMIYSLAVLVPSLAVAARRLHDAGRSGWLLLLLLVPYIGWVWLFVLLALGGKIGANKYGADPKETGTEGEKDRIQCALIFLIIASALGIFLQLQPVVSRLTVDGQSSMMLAPENRYTYFSQLLWIIISSSTLFFGISMLCRNDKNINK